MLGDLERFFATAIYPNRGAVAIVAVVVLAAIVGVAVRRRWDLAARRQPRTTLVVVGLALVLVLPPAWYLGSPLFLSSTVDEPGPVAGASPSPAASPADGPSAPASGTPASAGPTIPATPAPLSLTGTFQGADEFHFGRGTATLVEVAPGSYVVRLEGFEVRNGPDLFVYLSPSAEGYAEGAIELGALKADKGNQNYEVPAGVSVAGAMSVVIWCRQFAVQFAAAPLG